MRNKKKRHLFDLLQQHSFEDLAESFFVLTLWLRNIASPIKAQFLFTTLESMFPRLAKDRHIHSYPEFKSFAETLIKTLPSFPFMEDYVPEQDWGNIKYFFQEKFYKVLYGGDLSTSYDFRYAFEVIHSGFDQIYQDVLGRSALDEFTFEMSLEQAILTGISKTQAQQSDIERGHFEVPPEAFWVECKTFLSGFDPSVFDPNHVRDRYTKDILSMPAPEMLTEQELLSKAQAGKNCFYFLVKKDDQYFPVLPRRNLAILLDTWGELLADLFPTTEPTEKWKSPKISIEFSQFVRERMKQGSYFDFPCAIDEENNEPDIVFATAFLTDEQLIPIYVMPPYSTDGSQQDAFNRLGGYFPKAERLLGVSPTRVGLMGEGRIVAFEPNDGRGAALKSTLIACFPSSTSYTTGLKLPSGFRWRVYGLEQLLGIIDELENTNEFADFLEYENQLKESVFDAPFASGLDLFGSFKDSSSVLITGAINYTSLMLDPHWGSNHRYKTLSDFWQVFPEIDTFGHPRGWRLDSRKSLENVNVFTSRSIFAYFRHVRFESSNLIINAPVNEFSYEQGEITEFMMDGFADALEVYRETILRLPFTGADGFLHILFFPMSAVEHSARFSHLTHLLPIDERWSIDFARLRDGNYGIRIVFDDKRVAEESVNATTRELQVSLLIDVLSRIDANHNTSQLVGVTETLNAEKSQLNRYRTFEVSGRVAFPRWSHYVLPGIRERKLSQNVVATIARNNDIEPGQYEGSSAKAAIHTLILHLRASVKDAIESFDIDKVVPFLISNIDALVSEKEFEQARIKNSLTQEVEFERVGSASDKQLDFGFYHGVYRYLIEKFVSLQPSGGKRFSERSLAETLALIESLLHLYFASDQLHYGIYGADLIVSHDYTIDVLVNADVEGMQRQLAEVEAQIELGEIGSKTDRVSVLAESTAYLSDLEEGFLQDTGFTFSDLLSVLQLLSHWGFREPTRDIRTSYSASVDEIAQACKNNIDDFDLDRMDSILRFLHLDPGELLTVSGSNEIQPDIPVWEHRKRTARYNLRPLIKLGDSYQWGPFSADRSKEIWGDIFRRHKLPCDFIAPRISAALERGHDRFTQELHNKIEEISRRHTSFVVRDVFPHRLGLSEADIGDVDVLALSEDKSTLFNIESKVIDEFFCNKDMKRTSEKIFGRMASDGSFRPGYLQAVEQRGRFLDRFGSELARKFWKDVDNNFRVVSLFVTAKPLWWTMFPPVNTEVQFVEIRLLDDFLKNYLRG